jgi:hypothetical protein
MVPHLGQLAFLVPDTPAHPKERKAKSITAIKVAVITKYFCLAIHHLPY